MDEPVPGPYIVSDEREVGSRHFATVISHSIGEHRGVEVCRLNGGKPYRNGEGIATAHVLAASLDLLEQMEALSLIAAGLEPAAYADLVHALADPEFADRGGGIRFHDAGRTGFFEPSKFHRAIDKARGRIDIADQLVEARR